MPAIQEITDSIIRGNIVSSVTDVFKTMLGRVPTMVTGPGERRGDHEASVVNSPCIVGTVGFVGEINGLIYLYFSEPFARICTRQLLGMSEAEIDEAGEEVVNDAIGEMTNMTVGGFKNSLCDAGYPCSLTIPSILRGSHFSIEPITSTVRYVFHFECTGHQVMADIVIKTGD